VGRAIKRSLTPTLKLCSQTNSCKCLAARCFCLKASSPSLHKILLHFEPCVHEFNRPFILPARLHCPHVAILLHGYWEIDDPPPDPVVYAIHHTLLVMAISCKGQIFLASAHLAPVEMSSCSACVMRVLGIHYTHKC